MGHVKAFLKYLVQFDLCSCLVGTFLILQYQIPLIVGFTALVLLTGQQGKLIEILVLPFVAVPLCAFIEAYFYIRFRKPSPFFQVACRVALWLVKQKG